ncbi:MAG: ABC-2 type transport system ATP-binding protein [Myxococcota bacterium]
MTTASQNPVSDTAVLRTRALTRAFRGVPAVNGLNLAVQPGELYGLVGPDGAGKTTTIRMLAGLVRPDAGEALVLGMPAASGAAAVREVIGYMPQQYSLYGDLSCDENLTFFGRLFGLKRAERRARADELLRVTQLERFRGRRADNLSGGMYKKLALACALLHRPRVLVLDEPSNGVDPVSRREIWEMLYRFVADGMGVLLATPYMDEAARCHRVGLLDGGALLAEGPPRELMAAFPHPTLRVVADDRDAVEAALRDRPEVLALSPHGRSLRVVVRDDGFAALSRRLDAHPGVTVERITPDFEDVYLGLLATVDRAPNQENAG